MKVKSESKVAQSCPILSDPMDCSLPGSSIHGIFQARVLEWGAIAFSNILENLPTIAVWGFISSFPRFEELSELAESETGGGAYLFSLWT